MQLATTIARVRPRLERSSPSVLAELDRRGHHVRDVGPWGNRSAVQLIVRGNDGVLVGGSDPRVTAGGLALGI